MEKRRKGIPKTRGRKKGEWEEHLIQSLRESPAVQSVIHFKVCEKRPYRKAKEVAGSSTHVEEREFFGGKRMSFWSF